MPKQNNQFLTPEEVETLEQKYKPSTVKTIERNLKSIFVNVYGSDVFNIDMLAGKNAGKVISYLESQPQTRQTTLLFAIKAIMKVNNKSYIPYNKITAKAWEQKHKNDKYKPPSEKELKKQENFNLDLLDEVADIQLKAWVNDKESLVKYEKMLLTQFLTELPPLRAQDYTNIKVLSEEPEDLINHINLSTGELVIYDYKTQKYYGKREIELPEDLVMLIHEGKEIFDNEWLFPKLSDLEESQTSKSLLQLLQRTFQNDDIGFSLIRKLYVSKLIDDGTPAHKLQDIAQLMAHSVNTQLHTYASLSKKLHPIQKTIIDENINNI